MADQDAISAIAREFARLCEVADLHGLLFQHYVLCHRRAWLHMNRVDYAHLDERMQRGLVLHDKSKPRDRSVIGLMGLAPDRIDWKNSIVIEAKGGSGAVAAVSAQTAFYALILTAATNRVWRAVNEIIEAKRKREVTMDVNMAEKMLTTAEGLSELRAAPTPPLAQIKPICAHCSYRHLCGFA